MAAGRGLSVADIDEKLEELVALWTAEHPLSGEREQRVRLAPALVKALLDARRVVNMWAGSVYECRAETCKRDGKIHLRKLNAEMLERTQAALTDTELEEALGG